MHFEIISTPRLSLRKLTPETLKHMFASMNEEKLRKELGCENDDEWNKELERFNGGYSKYNQSMVFFQILNIHTKEYLGGCGFHTWFPEHRRAEIGYHLKDDNNWGKGYMTEAIKPVVDYGFHVLNLNRIEALIGPDNLASQKLVLQLGFVQEGVLHQHYNKNGELQDSIMFALLRKDYAF